MKRAFDWIRNNIKTIPQNIFVSNIKPIKNEQNTDQLLTDQSQKLNEIAAALQLFEVTTSNIDYKILRQWAFI